MRVLKIKLLLTILLLPGVLAAQETWGLKTCMTYALKNHKSTRVYENNRIIADAQVLEARAAYLPSLNITGSIVDNVKPQVSVIPAGAFSATDMKVAFTKQYNTTGTAELTQTIYDQAAITGMRAGKYTREQVALNDKKNQELLIYNVSVAYYQVYVYRLQLDMLSVNLNSYEEQIKISQIGVQKGVTTETDLSKIKVNYNNTLSNISVAQTNLEYYETQLKNAMGYPLQQPLQLDSMSIYDDVFQNQLALENDSLNVQQRTDYRLSQVNASLLDISARQIRAGAFPQLSAYARYGIQGFGDQFNEATKNFNDVSVIGINLKFPVFTGFKRQAQYTQAKYKQLNAMENSAIDADSYAVEYKNAKAKLVQSSVNVTATRENVIMAEQVFESTDLQYQKGVTDLTDWLNAQNSLKEAQGNFLNAVYTYYTATIELEKAKGTLINFYTSL
ncbi:MAG TPA: TolC family protein [Cyclobacteriaceae bacterium]|jgi:outer membrane protein TolC|nr:TolC family protein [Cyclobacteriaceae bacterium]